MPNIRGSLNQIKAKLKTGNVEQAEAIIDSLLARKKHQGGKVVDVHGKKYRVQNEREAKALRRRMR